MGQSPPSWRHAKSVPELLGTEPADVTSAAGVPVVVVLVGRERDRGYDDMVVERAGHELTGRQLGLPTVAADAIRTYLSEPRTSPRRGQARRNSTRAALNSVGWEAFRPCGPPLMTTSFAPGMEAAERLPLTSKGTMASASPWMINVGTSIFFRSARRSVRPKAAMQSSVPLGEANDPMRTAYRRRGSLTLSSPRALKKSVVNCSRKAARSVFTAASKLAMVVSSSPPSGLSLALYR